jgi:hypothetical protein
MGLEAIIKRFSVNGITSFGVTDANFPGVYTRVDNILIGLQKICNKTRYDQRLFIEFQEITCCVQILF